MKYSWPLNNASLNCIWPFKKCNIMVSHCFNLQFPDDIWCGASFYMLAVSSSCVRLSHSVMSESLPPMDRSPPGFSIHGDSPGKNTGVGCHAHLQGIFSTKKSNPLAINTSSLVIFLKIFEFLKNQVVFFSLNFNNPLYILDSSPLSDVSFANIFS